jgi:hypothetical protein
MPGLRGGAQPAARLRDDLQAAHEGLVSPLVSRERRKHEPSHEGDGPLRVGDDI